MTGLFPGTYYVGAMRDVNETGFMTFEASVDYWGSYEASVTVGSNATGKNFTMYLMGP